MSYLYTFRCSKCSQEYDSESYAPRCISCGGVLNAEYNIELVKEKLGKKGFEERKPGVWKYHELLPISDGTSIVSLGEGGTYLHRCYGLAKKLGLDELYLKDETTNPTGAFIDRGTAVEVTVARNRGFNSVCCGTTGNLAVSLVAYAARAGLESKVFIGQRGHVDSGKLYQILAYAAQVEIVKDREEALSRAWQESGQSHCVMPSNPHFLEGVKTTILETCEQLDWKAPDWVVSPMGNGGHISMIWKGLVELKELGLIPHLDTRLIGVQAKGCSPIVEAFERGSKKINPSSRISTVAVDIGVKNPTCGHMALEALEKSNGLAVSVTDRDILEAVKDMARLEGVFAEPASATTIAVLQKLVSEGRIDKTDRIVCVITGMGLKYPEITRSFVKGKSALEYFLSHVEGRRFTTKLGQTKVRILQILSIGEAYGYAIWKSLVDDYGMQIKIPSIYQHISELKNSGLIVQTRSEETYRKTSRNYYGLTERGHLTLDQLEKLSE
ncbi:MAG: threonine synthase [Candidatus Sifarchaeia archaeon]